MALGWTLCLCSTLSLSLLVQPILTHPTPCILFIRCSVVASSAAGDVEERVRCVKRKEKEIIRYDVLNEGIGLGGQSRSDNLNDCITYYSAL